MSKDQPSPRRVTLSFTSAGVGSQLSAIVTGSQPQVVPSFFIQALPSNTGHIHLGVSSTVDGTVTVGSALVASNAIVTLDSGQSVEIKASEWDEHQSQIRFQDFIVSASATADKAVISFFV